jgi:hypothetical protein
VRPKGLRLDTDIVTAQDTNDLSASVELDEESLVKVL